MIKRLFFSSLVGLIIAGLLLFFFPSLRMPNSTPDQDPSLLEKPLSYSFAVKKAAPAVVNIYNVGGAKSNGLPYQPLGSGVIMNREGYVITNKHVIDNAQQIIVALQDGRIFNAKPIGSDELVDIAVLKIKGENLPVIPINLSRTPHIGDIVLAIGNPYNIGQTITQGIVSATGRDGLSPYRRQNFIQTDASINKGNSGGALVNSLGELVGINTLTGVMSLTNDEKFSPDIPEGINFALPTSLAIKIMDKLIRDGRVIRGYIGIDGVEVSIRVSQESEDKVKGILIRDADFPALEAGLKPNDVIISVNQIPVSSIVETMDQISEILPGEKALFKILRKDEQLEIEAIIRAHPTNLESTN